ncbi:hypothetical protein ANN_01070 [Periplaneta americana]|uniref:Uncharacterized protein n=1 Tax=Periplaneta americana TaxID=6978 RepID=A0ABQ8TSJ4_PERAM|nr:hypothetical protein ANN_01070 [Periplaneta americana]
MRNTVIRPKASIVNVHNKHAWADENPHAIEEARNHHRFSVNVWARIIGSRLIGQYIPNRQTGLKYNFISNGLPVLLRKCHTIKCRLKVPYNENEDIRRSVRMLLDIPFVPLADVEDVFEELSGVVHDDVEELVNYIDLTYVRDRPARGRRHAVTARYPPELWNMYQQVIQGKHHTNNIRDSKN